MRTWKLTLEYDGTKYRGWQEQRNARTVMGELRTALEAFFGGEVDLHGSGRTDAGVHAIAQVAHVRSKTTARRHPDQIRRVLNDKLPADIVVTAVEEAPNAFHARHDAVSRTYVYQISTRKSAFSKKYVWWIKDSLDVPVMARAARMIEGRHDFHCFRAVDPSKPDESSLVVVESAAIETEDDLIVFRITASHFLWRMVRRLAGVLVRLGLGEITMEDFERLLAARTDPKLDVAAWTAPSSGLFLESVSYRRS
ncbi:MAG: tRNA pseudouridine(38-40) synthase TruA [Acidobacteria bacterium]|nr:tRNA pseudouridine(38-40) synthase TruA [Acidobacteriota bacterium]